MRIRICGLYNFRQNNLVGKIYLVLFLTNDSSKVKFHTNKYG